MTDLITLATWNVEWAAPRKRGAIRERIAAWDSDILVVTEGDHGVLPDGGFAADAGTDWGYRVDKPERRKVILWSRWPLDSLSTDVPAGVRTGRLVDATVSTPVGPIRVLAVCIPWYDAHVRTGIRPFRMRWREHIEFVTHLGRLLSEHSPDLPLVMMGDFNQRLPRTTQPHEIFAHLSRACEPLTVVTAGADPPSGLSRQEVDHIAVSAQLVPERVWGVDRHHGDRKLSDHDAVLASVTVP